MQELMWLQTIYKILFQHNKEVSNTKKREWENENENENESVSKSHMPLIQ